MVTRIRWQILIAVVTSLVVVAMLGAVALSNAAASQVLTGEVYVEGVVGTPRQLNPLLHDTFTPPVERDLAALIFAGLTRIDAQGRAQPDLAARWTVSDNGRVYVFTLRADRTWHDGRPVTAADVVATVRGVQNGQFPGDPALAAFWRNVLVEALDARTVRFELAAPFAGFPAAARLPLVPAHLYGALPPERWPTAPWSLRPIGAGPYRLLALDDTQAVLAPHTVAAARFDYLVLRFYPTMDAAAHGLLQREVQSVATVAVAGRRAPAPAPQTTRLHLPLGEYTLLAFNLQHPPLDDVRFRRALALGINRDVLIANVLAGQGRPLDTPILPGTWAADPTAQLPAFRRSEAQQWLGQIGYADSDGDGWLELDGERLTLPLLIGDTPEYVALAQELARQLRAIGIALEIHRVPLDELPNELAAHNFTLALHRWSNVGDDPDVYALWHSSRAEGGTNYAGLRDARSDELLAEARTTTDATRRRELYRQFQQRWVTLIPSLPLYQSLLAYDLDRSLAPMDATPGIIVTRADRLRLIALVP